MLKLSIFLKYVFLLFFLFTLLVIVSSPVDASMCRGTTSCDYISNEYSCQYASKFANCYWAPGGSSYDPDCDNDGQVCADGRGICDGGSCVVDPYCYGSSYSCDTYSRTTEVTCERRLGCTWYANDCLTTADHCNILFATGQTCSGVKSGCSGTYYTTPTIFWNGIVKPFNWNTYYQNPSDPCNNCGDDGYFYRADPDTGYWYKHTCAENRFIFCLSVRPSESYTIHRKAYTAMTCNDLDEYNCNLHEGYCVWGTSGYGQCTCTEIDPAVICYKGDIWNQNSCGRITIAEDCRASGKLPCSFGETSCNSVPQCTNTACSPNNNGSRCNMFSWYSVAGIAEICDNIDNDCDGIVNEGLTETCSVI